MEGPPEARVDAPAEDPAEDGAGDPLLGALWERALASWDDDKVHAAILDHALRTSALPEVAGRYRALVDDPVKGPVAKKRLDALVLAATHLLFSTKSPRPDQPIPIAITLSAFGICIFLLAWLALAMYGKH